MYEVETRNYEPKNFFAGDFPTVPESGITAAAVEEFMPVEKDSSGKIIPTTKATVANVIGITATAAGTGEPVVYYMTGEFFADVLNLPAEVEIADLKDTLRKVSIFLR